MSDTLILPHKTQIKERYASFEPVFAECLERIENRLKECIVLSSRPTYKARIKSFDSYYNKILRQKSKEASEAQALIPLTDMMGIRIICAFLEDIGDVVTQLSQHFEVREVERKGAEQSFREFGYESVHVLIAIPDNCRPVRQSEPVLPPDVVCEIQVRTILQDAWAEVEHELIYKSEFNPFDKPLRRKLAAINANLCLADTIFQEIRDYQKRLQTELGLRRNTFYSKADKMTDDEFGLSARVADESDEGESLFAKGSIDDLVLQALHEHNIGHFTRAVEIYTSIINYKQTLPDVMLSVILKHRGMAYFAQSDYAAALADFQESERRDAKAFRSFYYEGIVYSVQGDDRAAITCYDRSLDINSYQSHVYYRRALAYFNLQQYQQAMHDVNSAIELGLDSDEVHALKARLLEKFDMNV